MARVEQSCWRRESRCDIRHHSLVVETSQRDQAAEDAPARGFSEATLVNEGMMGGVERFREFVVFHAENIYPEYLLAYRRGGAESSSEPEPEPETIEE